MSYDIEKCTIISTVIFQILYSFVLALNYVGYFFLLEPLHP